MSTRNAPLALLACGALAILCATVRPAAGMIIARPIEYSLAHAHVIVAGKIVEVTADIKVKRGSGSNSFVDYYRLGYVRVDEVLKNDLAHFTLAPGDRIEIELGPTAERAKALARERAKNRRFSTIEGGPYHPIEKGDGGIWLLYLSSPGQRRTFALSSLLKVELLGKTRDKLDRLERTYRDALEHEIPRHAEQRQKFLSTPALTQAMADAAMGKAIAPEIDLSNVCVVNYGNMQALFVAGDGRTVGGVPYHASYPVFREGYLPVSTALDHGYSKYNYVDRSGKLLCSKFYSCAESFSEGRALVWEDNRLAGYVDVTGKEIIPCRYRTAEPFSHGRARVSKDGHETVFIDKTGTTVGKETGERSRPEGLVTIDVRDEEQEVRLYGFADQQGNTVIPPKFLGAMDFSDGMAEIETTVWVERTTGYYGNPEIELSEKAPQHMLAARRGFINEKGEIAVDPLFDSTGPFLNGLATVRIYLRAKDPGQAGVFEGLIDKAGNLVLVKSNPSR
jgi:hypothetical protein